MYFICYSPQYVDLGCLAKPCGGVDFGRDRGAHNVGVFPGRDLKCAESGCFPG